MSTLEALLADSAEDVLLKNSVIREQALKELKVVLDPIAKEYSVLGQVHVSGLDADQIFTQAQMVVDGAIESLYSKLAGQVNSESSDGDSETESGESDEEADESGDEIIMESGEEASASEESDEDDFDIDGAQDDFDENDLISESEKGEVLSDELEKSESEESEEDAKPLSKAAQELNTGLFKLEEFQQQVLQLENENDDDDSEEIDYFKAGAEEESSDDDLKYADFFAPPKKNRKGRNNAPPKKRARFVEESHLANEEDAVNEEEEIDYNAAMESMQRDLFASEDEYEEEETGEKLSKYEQQQAEIARQISELEDENVGEKFWAQRGEVQAKQRPSDSLVNTELEFDRNYKPAPVVTQDFTQSIEELIRERIKKEQFDDLPRRLDISDTGDRKSRDLPELEDTKSKKSLAELYEEDHQQQQNPEYHAQQESAAESVVHKAIRDMYNSVSRQLDALCSWQYTPRAPEPSLSVVTETPTVAMEESVPTTLSAASTLAPQEIFKPGSEEKGEIVGRDNLPISCSEMTSDERKRARRRAKAVRHRNNELKEEHKRAREASEAAKPKPMEATNRKKKQSTKDVIDTLKRGNVAVVDKRGQKRDLKGNAVKESRPQVSTHLKL